METARRQLAGTIGAIGSRVPSVTPLGADQYRAGSSTDVLTTTDCTMTGASGRTQLEGVSGPDGTEAALCYK